MREEWHSIQPGSSFQLLLTPFPIFPELLVFDPPEQRVFASGSAENSGFLCIFVLPTANTSCISFWLSGNRLSVSLDRNECPVRRKAEQMRWIEWKWEKEKRSVPSMRLMWAQKELDGKEKLRKTKANNRRNRLRENDLFFPFACVSSVTGRASVQSLEYHHPIRFRRLKRFDPFVWTVCCHIQSADSLRRISK